MSLGMGFALPASAWQGGGGKPVFSLNFLNGTLPAGVTFTRAVSSSSPTYIGSNGYMQFAGTNVARFDYSPSSYVYENLVNNSVGTAGWTTSNTTITPNAAIAPDGTNTGIRLTTVVPATVASYGQLPTGSAGSAYKLSGTICLKSTGVDRGAIVSIYDESSGGAISSLTIPSLASGGVDAGNGWRKYTLPTGTNVNAIITVSLRIYTDSTGGVQGPPASSIYFWAPQICSTATPSAYAATTAGRVALASIRGLLIEPARTNVNLNSEDYSLATWTKTNITSTSSFLKDPNNNNAGNFLIANADGLTLARTLVQATLPVTPSIGAAYTASVYFKYFNPDNTSYSSVQWVQLAFTSGGFGATAYVNFDIFNGVVGTVGASITSYFIIDAGWGWYRLIISANATAAVASGFQTNFVNNSASPVADPMFSQLGSQLCAAAWGSQMEAGHCVSTYMPTGSVAAGRSADIAKVTSVPWFNSTAGTLFVQAISNAVNPPANQYLVSLSDGTATNRVVIARNLTTANLLGRVNAVPPNFPTTSVAGVVSKSAIAYSQLTNDTVGVLGGTVAAGVTTTAPAGINTLNLGLDEVGTGNQLFGWLQLVNYYNIRLPNTTLQSITA